MGLHELLPLQSLSKSSHFNALPLWFPFLLALCWPTLDYTNSSAFTKSVVKFTSRLFQSCSLIFLLSLSALTITGFFWAASLAFASLLLKTASVLTHSVWRRGAKILHGFQDLIGPSEFSGLWLVWSLSCVLVPAQLCSCTGSVSRGWSTGLDPAGFLKKMKESDPETAHPLTFVREVDKITPAWAGSLPLKSCQRLPVHPRGHWQWQMTSVSTGWWWQHRAQLSSGSDDNSTASQEFEPTLF